MDQKQMLSEMNNVFAERYKAQLPAITPKDTRREAAGIMSAAVTLPTTIDICSGWKLIKPLLMFVLGFANWFFPAAQVAMAKAFIDMIDTKFIPMFCTPPQA